MSEKSGNKEGKGKGGNEIFRYKQIFDINKIFYQ